MTLSLGHARLSIIDTSKLANQTFTDVSERYTIVFNGEIYNYKELKEELVAQGVEFITNSDTEVLLYGEMALTGKMLLYSTTS